MKVTKELLDNVRHIDGFPRGEDDDIAALSIAPHYTAFPNHFIAEFVEEHGVTYDRKTDSYKKEPYVGDIIEGKNDPIYSVHAYHTKVPPKAIECFIEHYTSENDIILDGFCGSGMAGIAAINTGRNVILSDLSPIASFIAFNYCSDLDYYEFSNLANKILTSIKKEYSWMYETVHSDGRTGIINNVVWSDVFVCPYCGKTFAFWDYAVEDEQVQDRFSCKNCNSELHKNVLERLFNNDKAIQVPVQINYSVGKKRFTKTPDQKDNDLVTKVANLEVPFWFPTNKLPDGFNTEQPKVSHGYSNVQDFFTPRTLFLISAIFAQIKKERDNTRILTFWLTAVLNNLTKRYRFRTGGGGGPSGNLYIPSLSREINVFRSLEEKLKDLSVLHKKNNQSNFIISTQSVTDLSNIPENSIDYIFTDPPFGANIMYSELSYIWESWIKIFTNNLPEAIINNVQGKEIQEYRELMLAAFKQYYKVLKPNRWITVEFSNSKAAIWNVIQETLNKAGFIIAQVATFDKKQGSFKQVTAPNAVKQDLIISAYKPKKDFEERFLKRAGLNSEIEFLAQFLEHLPPESNVERNEQILYSKLMAYYIRHGFEISISAKEFYSILSQNFFERDGYWFLEDQIKIYEENKKQNRLRGKDLAGGALFIVDEKSAIAWLNHFLDCPKIYNDIYIEFTKALTVSEDQIPELKQILEENFVSEGGKYRRPVVLEKKEIEERREKRLLKEFEDVLNETKAGKKLKDVRKEAILAGFTMCYREKRFEEILKVGKKLPDRIVESSIEIFDYIDIAEAKVGSL